MTDRLRGLKHENGNIRLVLSQLVIQVWVDEKVESWGSQEPAETEVKVWQSLGKVVLHDCYHLFPLKIK